MILSCLTYKIKNGLKSKSTMRMKLQRKTFIHNLYRIAGEVTTGHSFNII